MKYHHIICLTLLPTIVSCTHKQPMGDHLDLNGAWVLQHIEYPSGTEEYYSMNGDGTYCIIYDLQPSASSPDSSERSAMPLGLSKNMLYKCGISTTPTGLVIRPTSTATVTLVDKGGGEWLYLEDGDPHPLSVSDSTITIQRNGRRYTYSRDNDLYSEWGDKMRDIIANEPTLYEHACAQRYILSVRERQQANHIYWLLSAIVVIVIIAVANYIVYRRRRQQLWLQLRQIQEVHENRPPQVRQAAKSVADTFFASDEYATLGRRMATGALMKEEEWQQVEQSLKTVYPGFTTQLRSLYPMSDVEYRTCLLIKLRIPTKNIAAVLAREVNTISTLRKRLYKKVFDREGGARDWDEFILSIDT